MRNDFGEEWTRQDYRLAVLVTICIVISILIPVGILIGFDYATRWNYHWYAWTIMFVAIFVFNIWITFRRK